MPTRPIAYNLVRLVTSAAQMTPRGVDRIDFGYLSQIFEAWPAECFGALPSLIGMRIFSRDRILRGRDRLAKLWSEVQSEEEDAIHAELKARLNKPDCGATRQRKASSPLSPRAIWRMSRVLVGDGFAIGRPIETMPEGSLYLDIGHYGLTFPGTFGWRAARPDIRPVFMIHDVIPLDYPEMVAEETVTHHRKVIERVAAHARALIVPTQSAGATIQDRLSKLGAPRIPIHAVPLPIDAHFLTTIAPGPALLDRPYFVICGAIEPRKNHALLLHLWRDLVRRMGDAAPILIIAGSAGYESGIILDQIRRSEVLRGHVRHVQGLSSPALARLMAGARALLMPSFTEGFGLPPIEAMALGTPAILSDIPAHRDAAGDWGLYADPTDAPAWRRHIESLLIDTPAALAQRQRLTAFKPTDWMAYMAEVGRILLTVD